MDVKKFMKFNNEKRVQMLGSVQTKYQMHISSSIETPWTPTFPFLRRLLPILLMKSQVIFIRRVGVATHAHNLLRVVGIKKKKKDYFIYWIQKNGSGSVQIVVEYEYSNNYLHINWRIVKVEVQAVFWILKSQ